VPDADGFPTADEIASGAAGESIEKARARQDAVLAGVLHQLMGKPATPEQVKAFRILVNCPTVVVLGMIETRRKGADVNTGCDFHTSLVGSKEVLLNAKDHLAGVIERAYTKYGVI
jgi:hypothetical protein